MSRSARSVAAVLLAAVLAALVAGGGGAGTGATPAPPGGVLLEALARPPLRASLASERIYFVLTDRYANGTTANDRGGRTGLRSVTGYDPADTGFFHGGDLRGLTGDCADPRAGLARIKGLGFTAVWITPPYRQQTVQAGSAAYHGYWPLGLDQVDPHLGTAADFAAFVACAHRLGLKVFLDVVVNHTGDAILPGGGSTWIGPDAKPYRDCRGRRFDPARYARGSTFPCLRAATMPRPPLLLPGSRRIKSPGWLNDPLRYHNRGDIDFDSCNELCYEQGDFFGLDDLFTEQPAVADGLARVYGDWIRRYRVDGFRIDTARHVNRAFFHRWVPRIRAAAREAGVRDFQLFGEAFIADAVELSTFVRDRGLPTVLDFPLQDALVRFAGGSAGAAGISARLGDDDYFSTPAGIAPTPPTFLGNHDLGRAALKLKEQGAGSGTALLRRDLLAHDLLYLLRGAPVVLYGDEVGIVGGGGDKAARQDLFPTGVTDWRREERVGSPPIGTGSAFDVTAGHPVAERLRALAALRDAHPALATGSSAVRLATRSALAVSRVDTAARREYVAAFNAGRTAARLTVPTATPGSSWAPLLGAGGATSDANGRLSVSVPALSTVLLRAERELPAAAPARPRVLLARDELSELLRVSAAAPGPVSVAFAVRRANGKAWTRLAADDSPPFRAFLDPARYRRGERVYVVAIARSLDGRTAVSAVVAATPRP